jgi:hypothetical protein
MQPLRAAMRGRRTRPVEEEDPRRGPWDGMVDADFPFGLSTPAAPANGRQTAGETSAYHAEIEPVCQLPTWRYFFKKRFTLLRGTVPGSYFDSSAVPQPPRQLEVMCAI